MGWAERLNPKSDWTLRNERRIVAANAKAKEETAHTEVIAQAEKRKMSILDWLYGRTR